jgi:diguanylate cyclase (GGDEF)-like protein
MGEAFGLSIRAFVSMKRLMKLEHLGSVPFVIRRDMIRSLYSHPSSMVAGFIGHLLGAAVCWGMTGDPIFLKFCMVLSVVFVFRIFDFSALQRSKETLANEGDVQRLETRYIIGAIGTSSAIGLMGGYSVVLYPNFAVAGVCIGLTCGTMVSVVGRNFGSVKNIDAIVFTCCGPTCFGLLYSSIVTGNFWFAVTACLLLPLLFQTRKMARNVHEVLLAALIDGRRFLVTSNMLELAVTNMPNGLLLVGEDNRVIASNERTKKLKDYSYYVEVEGKDLSSIIWKDVALDNTGKLSHTIEAFIEGRVSHIEVLSKDGRWLEYQSKSLETGHEFSFDNKNARDAKSVVIIEDVTQRISDRSDMEFLAHHDSLTKLPNRARMETLVENALAVMPDDGIIGIAVFDVDKFKMINDTLGHYVGDLVIQGVADKLRETGYPRVCAARWGGDEFVVCFYGLKSVVEGEGLFEELFDNLCSSFPIQGQPVDVRCSGGVVIRRKRDFDLHTDINKADMALYKVKADPQKAWMKFTAEMESEYAKSLKIKQDLRDAIRNQMLDVVYQPIYSADGQRIMSAEALCRWNHPELGQVPPLEFIGMAEEIGVIGQLTEYVLRSACRDCVTWDDGIGVSVNLSTLDLCRDDIVPLIQRALADFGLPANRLCVEVTETVFVRDYRKTAETLEAMRALGVKTSIDDFGTGYSSLSYLQHLPLNRVKIDRSFVTTVDSDEKSQKMFKGVVSLSKALGFEIVVEGVETIEQYEYILGVPGVDLIQGFIFSKVVTSDHMIYKQRTGKGHAKGRAPTAKELMVH